MEFDERHKNFAILRPSSFMGWTDGQLLLVVGKNQL
jgi:hypothetical protein